jgi:hypothetical protein
MISPFANYKRHRFPPEFIAYAVGLYARFNLGVQSRHLVDWVIDGFFWLRSPDFAP